MTKQNVTGMLIRKLRIGTPLDHDDLAAIESLPITLADLAPDQAIVREGERPHQSCLLLSGFAYRAKTTCDGKRQILSLHIPGEIPDLQSLHLHVMDHDLVALSQATVGFIPHEALRLLITQRPQVAAALWRETLIDSSIFREWIVVSRSPAARRVAHLVSELANRLQAIGLSADDSFELPMTQIDLADTLGLTPVHVNRVMQELRKAGLLDFRSQVFKLGDVQRLKELGDFDELYLHQSVAS
jgi:CRP-like cAMP-binding protein